jgi:hypothetical protein
MAADCSRIQVALRTRTNRPGCSRRMPTTTPALFRPIAHSDSFIPRPWTDVARTRRARPLLRVRRPCQRVRKRVATTTGGEYHPVARKKTDTARAYEMCHRSASPSAGDG